MKKALVQVRNQGGIDYGQVSNPEDLMKAQDFIHNRLSQAVTDFINRSSRPEVAGFDYTLGAGTAFNMLVTLPGRVWTPDGISYDLGGNDAARTVTFDAAHPTLPRIDIVVAVVEDEAPAALDLIPFVRLDIDTPPININAPTEQHWKTTIAIKKGTAATIPNKPVLASNEIPLYEVSITAGLTNLANANIVDVRGIVNTLRMLTDQYGANLINLSDLARRIAQLEDLGGQPIDLSHILGEIRSLEEILAELLNRTSSAADLPEIRYDRPRFPLWDHQAAMILAEGKYISGQSVIDFETGARINFGDAEATITPDSFHPSFNPRYVTIGSTAAHVRREQTLTMDDVRNIVSDGAASFGSMGVNLTPARTRPAVAARSSRYIEIFGGTSYDGASALGDWYTYDSENNTLTPKTLTGDAIPSSSTPAMFPYGDGTNVLVIAASNTNPGATTCFRVNCVTGVSTGIADIQGGDFFGDLIGPGKIFIYAMYYGSGPGVRKCYEFSTSTHTFTELTTTGNVPPVNGIGLVAGGCYYRENQFLFYYPGGSGKTSEFITTIFDRTTLAWTDVTVANKPWDFRDETHHFNFRIANIGGRPTLIGGDSIYNNHSDPRLSTIWEFTEASPVPSVSPQLARTMTWKQVPNVAIPPVILHGMASLLGTTSRPDGNVYVCGGYDRVSGREIYGSRRSGLIAASFGGSDGVTIGTGSTFVQFEVDAYTAAWDVAAYFASLTGSFNTQNVRLEVSLNNGSTWHVITPGLTTAIPDSAAPGVRRLRITLFRGGANPPILTALDEAFDQDGVTQVESRIVLRIDMIEDDDFYQMVIDRRGKATIEIIPNPQLPSSAGRCLLMNIVATASAAPTLARKINLRRPIYRVRAVKDATTTETVNSILAVPSRFYTITGIKAGTKERYQPTEYPVAGGYSMSVQIQKVDVPQNDTYEVVFYG